MGLTEGLMDAPGSTGPVTKGPRMARRKEACSDGFGCDGDSGQHLGRLRVVAGVGRQGER